MPTVLVIWPTVTEVAAFLPAVAVPITSSTHFAYPRRDDQAELAWVARLKTPRWYT